MINTLEIKPEHKFLKYWCRRVICKQKSEFQRYVLLFLSIVPLRLPLRNYSCDILAFREAPFCDYTDTSDEKL